MTGRSSKFKVPLLDDSQSCEAEAVTASSSVSINQAITTSSSFKNPLVVLQHCFYYFLQLFNKRQPAKLPADSESTSKPVDNVTLSKTDQVQAIPAATASGDDGSKSKYVALSTVGMGT